MSEDEFFFGELSSTWYSLRRILSQDAENDKKWKEALNKWQLAKEAGNPVPEHPPEKVRLQLSDNNIRTIKSAKSFIERKRRIQQIVSDSQKGIDLYHKIDAIARLTGFQDDELWNELKEIAIKCVAIEPRLHTNIKGLVAFTCPICDESTLLTHGTAFYHCPKCGQKLFEYDSDHWNIMQKDEKVALQQNLKTAKDNTKSLYDKTIAENWHVGSEYDLILSLPETAGDGIRFRPEKHRCTLIGKYPRYLLFEYEVSGVKMRKAVDFLDLKLAD